MTTIERPRGVEIHHGDGSRTPVELSYQGVDHGRHIWVSDSYFDPNVDHLHWDHMPGDAGLIFHIREDWSPATMRVRRVEQSWIRPEASRPPAPSPTYRRGHHIHIEHPLRMIAVLAATFYAATVVLVLLIGRAT